MPSPMKLSEYAACDAHDLAALVRTKQVSAHELALTAAAAIGKTNPTLKAVIEVYDDQLEERAAKALPDGPFRGVPFLIKDVGGHLKGRRIEFGSWLCQGMLGEIDTNFATLLKSSGLNILGRSNTPEFSMASSSENRLYGATTTPWKNGYSACGSSGGAAAAVAAGIVPLAHGSDIGGSIRGPAAWCGGIGLKPSRGRISAGPLLDEWGSGMAMNFAQSKSMRDTAALLDWVAVPQPGDPFVINAPPRRYASYVEKPRRKLRIAWSAKALMDTPVDQEIAKVTEQAANALAKLGHEVVEGAPPLDMAAQHATCLDIWFVGFDKRLDQLGAKMGRKVSPDTVERATYNFYNYAKTVQPSKYFDAIAAMNRVRRETGAFFAQHDVWLTPTCAQTAPKLGVYGMDVDLPPAEFIHFELSSQQFLVFTNVTGQPSMSLPLGMHSNGLPIGVQIAARHAEDHLLISLGAELEQAMPWKGRVPAIHVSRG